MIDHSTFPDPTYKDTVLAPLFEGARAHYVAPVRAINQAHLVMLVETGILTADQGRAIATALKAIDEEVDISTLTYTGEYEDYFFLVEAELRTRLGPDLAGMLHTARSRNDMDHTIFKMVLRGKADIALDQALDLAQSLLDTATRERDTPIVAYTHGQPAQPTTFGHYLMAVVDVLMRDISRLSEARDLADHCPMGAAAITTSGFPIDRHLMADLLGFTGPTANSYGSIASVDYITGLYSALKLLLLHLGRVIQDLQFWTAFEVGQLYVPNSLVQISSIMPQKRNPVPIEHMRHLASVTVGRCDTIVNTMHNTPFTDMNDSEGEVQVAGYAAFESAGRVLRLMTAIIPATRVREGRVQANMEAACVTVTELADTLVREESLSFRQAHEIAAITSKDVIARDLPLAKGFDAFSSAFAAQMGRKTRLDAKRFVTVVSPAHFISVRDRVGGPAPKPMNAALKASAQVVYGLRTACASRKSRISDADARLKSAYKSLMET